MKYIGLFLAILCCSSYSFAQNDASKKIDKSTERIKADVQTVSDNVKSIVKVFEPFFKTRTLGQTETPAEPQTEQSTDNTSVTPSMDMPSNETPSTDQSTDVSNQPNENNTETQNSNQSNNTETPTPPPYAGDGTANLGTQNNSKYGNYLDIGNGMIMDEIDAAGASHNVDLIFTATNFAGRVLYAFFSPYYAKTSTKANLYNYGIKYKRNDPHPSKSWEVANESTVALTTINGAQFEKIKNNAQLAAVVKQTQKFSNSIEVYDQLVGKVIAVKTTMDDRVCYGLMYIVNQYGTTGENSYIKVKLKVTGFDGNGDGNPDANQYNH
ncbi:MAG: hypothetical protein ACOYOA_14125 [Saprospiraceae bacterium]